MTAPNCPPRLQGVAVNRTLADWLALDETSRREALAETVEAARRSAATHGMYISVADDRDLGSQVDAAAGRPWRSIPVAVKDNIDAAGFVTTGGTSYLRGSAARVDAGALAEIRHLGAVVIGKTNLHELAFGITSNNHAHGPVRNPLDPSRSAGGSSGGSAATVAHGTVPLAFGTDTGGSVSIPAAYCGVAGFRPTVGRYPADGILHLSWTRDTVGTQANTVADLRLADTAITNQLESSATPSPRELVIGVPRPFYVDLDPGVAKVAQQALRLLEEAGATLIPLDLPHHLDRSAEAENVIVGWEIPRSILAYLRALDPPNRNLDLDDILTGTASPDVAAALRPMIERPVTAEEYRRAIAVRGEMRREYAAALDAAGVQAAVFPTSPVLPPELGLDDTVQLNGRRLAIFPTVIRHTAPGTVMGAPMVTVPAGRAEGLPVGMTFQGRFFDDPMVLAVTEAAETVLSPER